MPLKIRWVVEFAEYVYRRFGPGGQFSELDNFFLEIQIKDGCLTNSKISILDKRNKVEEMRFGKEP